MTRNFASWAGGLSLFVFAGILAASQSGDRATVPLEVVDRLAFVGVQADYATIGVEEVGRILTEECGLKLVGESLRSQSNVERRVFAVRAKDPDAALKDLKRTAKKRELVAERLLLSVVEGGKDGLNAAAARTAEGLDERIWSGWLGPRGERLWIFHEAKLTTKALEKAAAGAKLQVSWHSQAFELGTAQQPLPDLAALAAAAPQRLDLLHAVAGEKTLALHVYLRALDSLCVLEHEGRLHFCPDIRGKLIEPTLPGTAGWNLTFTSAGYPFL